MFEPKFVIKGIDRDGVEVLACENLYSSVYRAELASLEFYGDERFKIVWVERHSYATVA